MKDVNYWTFLISMCASVGLGMLWYGPFFGKQWMALSGIQMPTAKPAFKTMIKPIIIFLVGALCMSFVLARIVTISSGFTGVIGVIPALVSAFLVWIGFIVPVNLSFVAWEGKSWKLWSIHSGYWLVLLLIMGTVIGF